MNSIAALADIGRKIETKYVEDNLYCVTEFLDYLRWLADEDTARKVTVGQLWELFYEGIQAGRVWSDVCEELGLPVREIW